MSQRQRRNLSLWLCFLLLLLFALLSDPQPVYGQSAHRRAIDDPRGLERSAVWQVHPIDDPLQQSKSQIHDIFGRYVVRGAKVHTSSLRNMVDTGIKRLSGKADLAQAWRRFIHDEDVVALKFMRLGGRQFGTNTDLAAAFLDSLYRAGFKAENIMLVGLSDLPDEAEGTRLWQYGWQAEQVDFDLGGDHLAGWLDEVTAIINIPSILDDNIVGLRAALYNLSFELVKSPARWYKSAGDPFIPVIYDLPQIRGKVRLHIANALRICYYGGPEVNKYYIYDYGSLIFSVDPVALDRVALHLIQTQRSRSLSLPADVPDHLEVSYLDTAYAMGLGYNDLNFIEYQHTSHAQQK